MCALCREKIKYFNEKTVVFIFLEIQYLMFVAVKKQCH